MPTPPPPPPPSLTAYVLCSQVIIHVSSIHGICSFVDNDHEVDSSVEPNQLAMEKQSCEYLDVLYNCTTCTKVSVIMIGMGKLLQ